MGNTNYISSIVKVLEEPKVKWNELGKTIEMRVQFPITSNKTTQSFITLVFHESSPQLTLEYYKQNDFMVVEGYLSVNDEFELTSSQTVSITVLKVYPLFTELNLN